MPRNIDNKSKNILTYRPTIEFVEPEQKKVSPSPILKEPLTEPQTDKLENLATTVEVLGAAIQAQIDVVAKPQRIRLDPNFDAATIQAMLRVFPEKADENPMYITYDEYRKCRGDIMDEARNKLDTTVVGGFGTAEANEGGLRPELSQKAQVIKPLDVDSFQVDLIKILMNFLWKTFIRPPIAKIPFAGSVLPKELPKLPKKQAAQLNNAKKSGVKILGR